MPSPNKGWAFFMRAWQDWATGPTVKIRRPALFNSVCLSMVTPKPPACFFKCKQAAFFRKADAGLVWLAGEMVGQKKIGKEESHDS